MGETEAKSSIDVFSLPFQWKLRMATAWCRDAGLFAKMFGDVLHDIRRVPEAADDRVDVPLNIDQLLACFFLFAGTVL